jgi:hypothetical protein
VLVPGPIEVVLVPGPIEVVVETGCDEVLVTGVDPVVDEPVVMLEL